MKFQKRIKISERILLSENSPTFIIAEIGSNHNQSFQFAKKLINAAKNSGADAVKFQSLNFEETFHSDAQKKKTKKLYEKINLNEKWYDKINKYCKRKKIIFFSTPTYSRSIKILNNLKVPIYKIASTNFRFNPKLDLEIINTNKPVIISLGLSTLTETSKTLKKISSKNKKIILLHCISRYPTKTKDLNLSFIKLLKDKFNCIVGLSDHSMSIDIPSYAVAIGARVIEKHFTLSRKLDGPDHHYALQPKEFKLMVNKIRNIERVYNLQNIGDKKFNKEENLYIKIFCQKIVVTKNKKKNTKLKVSDLDGLISSNNKGIDCKNILKIKNLILNTNIKKNTILEWKHLKIKN